MTTRRLELFADVVCPFAYVGTLRALAAAERAGVPVVLRPILLGGLLRDIGRPSDPNAQMPAAKAARIREDAVRQAAAIGRSIRFPSAHPRRTVTAMRLVTAAPEADRLPLLVALWQAYWEMGLDVADEAVLDAIARPFGLGVADAARPDARDGLRAATDAAVAAGVFGAPTLRVWDGDRLLAHEWGADRVHRVEEALGLRPAEDPLGGSVTGGVTRHRPQLFHDFASPYSYLGSWGADALAARFGARVQRVPVVLGAVFRAIGTPDVPIAAFDPRRQAWTHADLREWAARRGAPFRFASRFPMRSLLALRVAIQAPTATDALYRAAWADDRDIADPVVVRSVLDEVGLPGAELVAGADDPAVRATLRANTEAAVAAGVCGAPTWRIGDALVWGQDRDAEVARRLAAP